MRIAIHQPNLFPWFAFFQKMSECDVFVLLNHAQYPKGGFVNRFEIDGKWYTLPVAGGKMPISEKRYHDIEWNWNHLKKQLPQFDLSMFDEFINDSVMCTNGFIIRKIASELELSAKIKDDYPTMLSATARLVDICKHYGATEYLSGISGHTYLDLKLFDEAGIKVIFQDESKMIKKPILECLK